MAAVSMKASAKDVADGISSKTHCRPLYRSYVLPVVQSCYVESVIPSKRETQNSSKTLLGCLRTTHSPREEEKKEQKRLCLLVSIK